MHLSACPRVCVYMHARPTISSSHARGTGRESIASPWWSSSSSILCIGDKVAVATHFSVHARSGRASSSSRSPPRRGAVALPPRGTSYIACAHARAALHFCVCLSPSYVRLPTLSFSLSHSYLYLADSSFRHTHTHTHTRFSRQSGAARFSLPHRRERLTRLAATTSRYTMQKRVKGTGRPLEWTRGRVRETLVCPPAAF